MKKRLRVKKEAQRRQKAAKPPLLPATVESIPEESRILIPEVLVPEPSCTALVPWAHPLPSPTREWVAIVRLRRQVLYFRRQMDDDDPLIDDVAHYGVKADIEVTHDFVVVDGERRLQAAERNGITHVWVIRRYVPDLLLAIFDGQCFRKDWTLTERCKLAEAYEAHVAKRRHGVHAAHQPNLAYVGIQSRDVAAEALDLGGRTRYEQIKKVVHQCCDAIHRAMDEGIIKPSAAVIFTELESHDAQEDALGRLLEIYGEDRLTADRVRDVVNTKIGTPRLHLKEGQSTRGKRQGRLAKRFKDERPERRHFLAVRELAIKTSNLTEARRDVRRLLTELLPPEVPVEAVLTEDRQRVRQQDTDDHEVQAQALFETVYGPYVDQFLFEECEHTDGESDWYSFSRACQDYCESCREDDGSYRDGVAFDERRLAALLCQWGVYEDGKIRGHSVKPHCDDEDESSQASAYVTLG